ncbi:helix-turn-helix domain-containing protein [Asticcacaulis sp.]|uniref:helix-turn-helix domain-containing protein n=1 Tax=Asticcacaulis sp. TaxID=1872648 RepID=UPI003F7BE140
MAFKIHILRDEADYQAALAAYERYFDEEPEPGSEAADHFVLLGLLLTRYEDEHFPLPAADPIEAVRFAMDRQGLTQSDLASLLGSRSRASEILNRRRELSLPQIRVLCREWGIPASALINPYPLARAAG